MGDGHVSLRGVAAALAQYAAQPKTIELEFPSWQIEEAGAGEYWTELIKAFEAKIPNVKIKKQQVPFREYVDKMTVRFAGNNPPDIVHLPTRNYLAFASQGWLAPLDEYLAQTDVKATYTKLDRRDALQRQVLRRADDGLRHDVLLQRQDAGRRQGGACRRPATSC